ncbi:unnamed protein product [Trichobilharzia regenti]|nr:unnamed protein product [Trichobilharzia regenti]
MMMIPDGEDQVKKRQLMELAIINGTYRAVNQRDIFSSSINSSNEITFREEDFQQHLNGHVILCSHSPPNDNSEITLNREW